MKRWIVLAFFLLVPVFLYGQKFETNLNVSPIMTFGSNKTSKSRIAAGFAGSIREFYSLTKKLDLGTGLQYAYNGYRLKRDTYGLIPEADYYYDSKLSIHTLGIPLEIRYKMKSNWIIQAGYGLSYILHSQGTADHVFSSWFKKEEERTAVNHIDDKVGREWNSFFTIGFGKVIYISDVPVLTGIYYKYSMKKYDFSHIDVHDVTKFFHYQVKPQQIKINIGIKF